MPTRALRPRRRLIPLAAFALLLAGCGGPGPGAGPGTGPDPSPTTVTPAVMLLGNVLSQLHVFRSDAGGIVALDPLLLRSASEACGAAVHGSRLYVGDRWFRVIYVYDLATAIGGGNVQPVATITPDVSGSVEPCGLDIDANGDLWVGDHDGERVLTFTNPGAWAGNQTLAPSRLLTIVGSGFHPFEAVIDLTFDGEGRLWVVDRSHESITRFDDPTNLPADARDTVPDLQITYVSHDPPPGAPEYSLYYPTSIAIDAAGVVYVGNDWPEADDVHLITRYDDAGSLVNTTAAVELEPSAYILSPLPGPFAVGLDPDGRLWAANRSRLERLSGYTADGVVNATTAAGVDLTPPTVSGGGMTWIPWSFD